MPQEEELVREHVDQREPGPTEADEAKVLEDLGYRLNTETGAYEGGDPDGDE